MIGSNVLQLQFDKPAGFIFEPGQFLQFRFPVENSVVWRSYSIASTPGQGHLEFCIKLVEGGRASGYFQNLLPGQEVEVKGPRGLFVCSQPNDTMYFVATGVGIAPIMSIINHRLTEAPANEGWHRPANEKIHLLFGVRNESSLFWTDRFEAIKKHNPNFSYEITLSRPSEGWKGLRGRVTDHLPIDLGGHYYLCGGMEMVRDVRQILHEKSVNLKNIHFEIF